MTEAEMLIEIERLRRINGMLVETTQLLIDELSYVAHEIRYRTLRAEEALNLSKGQGV